MPSLAPFPRDVRPAPGAPARLRENQPDSRRQRAAAAPLAQRALLCSLAPRWRSPRMTPSHDATRPIHSMSASRPSRQARGQSLRCATLLALAAAVLALLARTAPRRGRARSAHAPHRPAREHRGRLARARRPCSRSCRTSASATSPATAPRSRATRTSTASPMRSSSRRALYSSFDFPDKNAILSVTVDGTDLAGEVRVEGAVGRQRRSTGRRDGVAHPDRRGVEHGHPLRRGEGGRERVRQRDAARTTSST